MLERTSSLARQGNMIGTFEEGAGNPGIPMVPRASRRRGGAERLFETEGYTLLGKRGSTGFSKRYSLENQGGMLISSRFRLGQNIDPTL